MINEPTKITQSNFYYFIYLHRLYKPNIAFRVSEKIIVWLWYKTCYFRIYIWCFHPMLLLVAKIPRKRKPATKVEHQLAEPTKCTWVTFFLHEFSSCFPTQFTNIQTQKWHETIWYYSFECLKFSIIFNFVHVLSLFLKHKTLLRPWNVEEKNQKRFVDRAFKYRLRKGNWKTNYIICR